MPRLLVADKRKCLGRAVHGLKRMHLALFPDRTEARLEGAVPAAALALYFGWYNFCRIHKTLRVTPAMEAGLATMPRDAEWVVELVDAAAPKPAKPGPKPGSKPSRARI